MALPEDMRAQFDALALEDPEKFIESLPQPVKARVQRLKDLQGQHDELEEQYEREMTELDAKYQRLYSPLYDERRIIVAGQEPGQEQAGSAGADPAKGVPNFWLTALMRSESRELMNEKDVEVLKYLIDIRADILEGDAQGFRLRFLFTENPYFTNQELTKTYYMLNEGMDPVLEKAEGTQIDWKPGKNVTVKVMKKKPKKGAANSKPQTKLEPVESFFNFFSPPQVPEEQSEVTEEALESLHESIETDYEIGICIKEKIIPRAVLWYTGEALDDEEGYGFGDDDDDDEGEEDEDDEGDDEEGGAKLPDGQNPECKQQ